MQLMVLMPFAMDRDTAAELREVFGVRGMPPLWLTREASKRGHASHSRRFAKAAARETGAQRSARLGTVRA